jgi:hypothetical protein
MKTKNLTLAEAVKTGCPTRKMNASLWWDIEEFSRRNYSFAEATEPIWEVKAEPREFEVTRRNGMLLLSLNLEDLKDGEVMKSREVLDEYRP